MSIRRALEKAVDSYGAGRSRDSWGHVVAGLRLFLELEQPDSKSASLAREFMVGRFGNTGAGLDDEEGLQLMARCAARLGTAPDPGDRYFPMAMRDPELATERYLETLTVMQWIEQVVEANGGQMELTRVEAQAARQGKRGGVRTRVRWMHTVDRVHVQDDVVYLGPRQVPAGAPPHFELDKERGELRGEEQRAFYAKFRASVLRGEAPDLAGEYGYGRLLLDELADELWPEEAETFRRVLELVRASYDRKSNHPLYWSATHYLADLCFLEGDFVGGYDVLVPWHLDFDLYLNLAEHIDRSRLSPEIGSTILQGGTGLTAFGRKHRDEVDGELQALLDEFHDRNGRSVLMDMWHRLTDERPSGELSAEWSEELSPYMQQDEIVRMIRNYDGSDKEGLWYRDRENHFGATIRWPVEPRRGNTSWIRRVMRAKWKSLYREAENRARQNIGVPRVGEGWVSEMRLLEQIREAFPYTKVVHQGRPRWLGNQSLDIFLPEHMVAIEYQGDQHFRPVDYFGGEEHHQRQLVLDATKRRLCRSHGCELIEVYPGYEIDDVVRQVRLVLAGRGG